MKRHLWIVLLLCAAVCGQTTPPPPPPPPAVPQQPSRPPVVPPPAAQQPVPPEAPPGTGENSSGQAPEKAAKPQTRITAEQAKELFRSVDEILRFVSQDTALPIKHPVQRQLADRNQVEKYIQERMKDDEDAKRLERSSVVLKKFGLVPRDFNLQQFLVALLKEQVAGYYDSKTKTVYLLDWVDPDQQKPVLAHELTHALQDQNFGLEQLSKSARKNDPTGLEADERLAARQAVIEGQGMIVLMDYMLEPMGSSVKQQPELVDAMQAGLTATAGMVVFNRAPMFLQQVLLFPYRFGTLFERDMLVRAGKQKAFADALKNPPVDTRQIMEPATYLQGTVVPLLKPLDFDKLARDYKKWDVSIMGEFDVFLLLNQYASVEVAKDLSKQWRGGYYWAGRTSKAPKADDALTTGDLAVVYVSRWADAHAAGQFAGAYSEAVSKRYPGAHQVGGPVTPKLQEAPGTGIQITISPILTGPVAWETSEGQVTIEPRGDLVLVMESFDPQTAKTIRDAVLQ